MPSTEIIEPVGRLIVIAPGAHWPSWLLRYRELGPGDAVIAHDNGETLGAFLDRVKIAAVELVALDLAPQALLLCLPEPRDGSVEAAEEVASKLSSLTALREIVLVSCDGAGARDGRRAQHLRRALRERLKHVAVRVEAQRPSGRKVRDAAYALVHRLHPGV